MPRFQPVEADQLADLVATDLMGLDRLALGRLALGRLALAGLALEGHRRAGALRVAIDGPLAAGPHELADAIAGMVRIHGRPAIQVRAETFWRDASLRLEFGHTDSHSLLHDWLDLDALRRELLDPLGADGTGRYLPSLRDPATNRATREPPRTAEPGAILLLSGELLLGHELPFDRTVHLALSAAARQRRTPGELHWKLAAYDEYDAASTPITRADIVIKVDDPRHPALRST